jgi:hypothetical protein
MGLTPPQVMERLGVRSLDGLNLAEALELLRRQLLREGANPPDERASAAAAPAASTPQTPPSSNPATTPAAANGRAYFEEEDDYDVSFVPAGEGDEDEEEPEDAGFDSASPTARGVNDFDVDAEVDEVDELNLDEVPDFGAPTPLRATHADPAPEARRTTAARAPASPATADTTDSAPGAPADALSLPRRARARELLAQLRATPGGGTPARSQLVAYANIVADQLGAPTAAVLTQGVWGAAPERLGTDQLNALIQWGKEDAFAEEAPAVLTLLRAERAASETGDETGQRRSTRAPRTQATRRSDGESGGMR